MSVHPAQIADGTTLVNPSRRVALVRAAWHGDLVGRAILGCREELARTGVDCDGALDEYTVPGSLEIPFIAKKLAASGKHTAVIAFGLIVNGGIYRHEFVAASVIDGLMQAQLDTGTPVFSCVLTPIEFRAEAPGDAPMTDHPHHCFFHDHLHTKGVEVARAAMNMLKVLKEAELD